MSFHENRKASIQLWVVIPCFNEAAGVRPTLDALRNQTDQDFSLVLVDNASTDGTSDVLRVYIDEHGCSRWQLIKEMQKGTGAAADTGFRHAIAKGATHIARTDADCLARHDWIANIKGVFNDGAEFIAGHIGHRTDDYRVSHLEMVALILLTQAMAAVSPFFPHNRGPEFLGPYVLAGGGNMALAASVYAASGGFPRIAIDEDNDDRVFQNRVRTVTRDIRGARNVVVYQSVRRVKHYGFRNTLLWYWNRKYRPKVVDVR